MSKFATIAAGCFWGVEEAFRQLPGVLHTQVGYCGGTLDSPTYQAVCRGDSGHAEAVQIEFDPQHLSYTQLLDKFWSCHDPTTLNRQGPDIGRQYRSAIFYHDQEQQAMAQASKERQQQLGQYTQPIVTEIVALNKFYPAEEYHQCYLAKKRGEL